jgi:FkbM family methyltransferase
MMMPTKRCTSREQQRQQRPQQRPWEQIMLYSPPATAGIGGEGGDKRLSSSCGGWSFVQPPPPLARRRRWFWYYAGFLLYFTVTIIATVRWWCYDATKSTTTTTMMLRRPEEEEDSSASNGSTAQAHPPLTTTARPCGSDDDQQPPPPYWQDLNATYFRAQSGEDEHLLHDYVFGGLCGGSYVELGALDGVTISNSHVFNAVYKWRGVLIELAPTNYAQLVMNRRDELVPPIHAAVCDTEQTVHYIAANGKFWGTTAGIWEFMSVSFRATWWQDVRLADTVPIRCTPLRQLLQENTPHVRFYDFLSLDVEGAELQVLQSINFTATAFGVILVEADDHSRRKNLAVCLLLRRHGYVYIESWGRSDWFVHPDFDIIYDEVMTAAAAAAAAVIVESSSSAGSSSGGNNKKNELTDVTTASLPDAVGRIAMIALQQQQQQRGGGAGGGIQ